MWMFFCYRKYHLKSISRTWIVSKPCLTQVAGTFPKQHRHFILGFHPFWKIKFWNFCLSLSRQAEKTLTNIFFLKLLARIKKWNEKAIIQWSVRAVYLSCFTDLNCCIFTWTAKWSCILTWRLIFIAFLIK